MTLIPMQVLRLSLLNIFGQKVALWGVWILTSDFAIAVFTKKTYAILAINCLRLLFIVFIWYFSYITLQNFGLDSPALEHISESENTKELINYYLQTLKRLCKKNLLLKESETLNWVFETLKIETLKFQIETIKLQNEIF